MLNAIPLYYQKKVAKRPKLSSEFLRWLDRFIIEYRPALKELAKK